MESIHEHIVQNQQLWDLGLDAESMEEPMMVSTKIKVGLISAYNNYVQSRILLPNTLLGCSMCVTKNNLTWEMHWDLLDVMRKDNIGEA